jgi:hypothetical protein
MQTHDWLSTSGTVHDLNTKGMRLDAKSQTVTLRNGTVFATVSSEAAEALLKLDDNVVSLLEKLRVSMYIKGYVPKGQEGEVQGQGQQ